MEKDNTYPDSGNSSPHSRDIDSENHSWEDQPAANYRVKFMCSYNGKIQPRPHDNQLTYVGGDTKILAVDRAVKFGDMMNKLSIIANSDVVFKYQLPGEDLDALISVTNDEDLEHMMAEYDRVYRLSPKPPRLRLFLFPNKNLISKSSDSNESESKMRIQPNQQWLADSVNSVPTQLTDKTQHTQAQAQEFLFPEKLINVLGETSVDDTAISHVEIQRQIHQLQRMQIANQEQAMFRKNSDEALARAFHSGDYYQEKTVPAVNVPGYWQDINGGYTTGAGAGNEHQHPLYLIPPQGGMYQQQPTTTTMIPVNNQSAMYPVTSQQGYYPMQRGPPEVYREQPVFSVGPPQPKIIARPGGGGGGVGETGYTQQVAYDSAGRQVFYTAAPAPGSVMPGPYHTVVGTGGVDLRHVGQVNVNQEGNVATTAAI